MTEYSNFHLVMSNFIRSYVKNAEIHIESHNFHSKIDKCRVKCTVERYFKNNTFGLDLKFHEYPWLDSFCVLKSYVHGHQFEFCDSDDPSGRLFHLTLG